MFIMKDQTHGLLESKTEKFSEIIHEIADSTKSIGSLKEVHHAAANSTK